MDIRLLKANEIECRVQSVKKSGQKVGCILLLYKDARVDMKLLDEIYGATNWQRTHELINGNLFCNIEIWDDVKKCWVKKQDVGVESNTEKEKGQASDSFKRAGFNWGIGRELYTSPFIWVDLKEGEYYEKDNKQYLSSHIKFEVKSIGYNDEREITSLQIKDNHNVVRYDLKSPVVSQDPQQNKPANNPPAQPPKTDSGDLISEAQAKRMFAIASGNTKEERQDTVRMILKKHNYEKSSDVKKSDYEAICNELANVPL